MHTEMACAFQKLKHAQEASPFPDLNERCKVLLALQTCLEAHHARIVKAISEDFGYRASYESYLLELYPLLKSIRYTLKHLASWMRPERRPIAWLFRPGRAEIMHQPLGVAGIIVPWNYPLFLALSPAISAIAAGNRVCLKLSELSPNLTLCLQTLMSEDAVLNTWFSVQGGDKAAAAYFTTLPFGHILYTGSTPVGKLVMASAANNLCPVTLELGGKSPVIIAKSACASYFERIFSGKLINAGQTCLAPDTILVHRAKLQQFIRAAKTYVNQHFPDYPKGERCSSIISQAHYERLTSLVADAVHIGCQEIIQIGEDVPEERRFALRLVLEPNLDCRLMKEEIFGPILPVLVYDDFTEAKSLLKMLATPLVAYYFGDDKDEKNYLKYELLSGALLINDTISHVAIDSIPFGGVGNSGMGQYHGHAGFVSFSKAKPIVKKGWYSSFSWVYPPKRSLLKMFLRVFTGIRFHD